MRVATLKDLPAPPPGKTGWPWTEESPPLQALAPDGSPWPRISIVTPSYNQGRYIEETIRSVLLQGYPSLEYIVFDGGSTDETVEIIRRYEPWISHWASERDRGQTHAINKGLAASTGEVFNWINSDDQVAPGALAEVGRLWRETTPHLLVGRGLTLDVGDRHVVHDWAPKPPRRPLDFLVPHAVILSQPSTYLSTALLRELGAFREDLHFIMDWELYLRLTLALRKRLKTATTPVLLSTALAHPEAKTSSQSASFTAEAKRVLVETREQWTALEWQRMAARLRRMEAQERAGVVLASPGWRLARLAGLPFRYPDVLWARFYWGAVRRALGPRSGGT